MVMPTDNQTGERPELYIQLLGDFGIRVGTRAIGKEAWRLRKAAAIVKLLALAPNHQLDREQITDILWPHLGPQAAANNLRHALYIARHILEPARSPGSGNGCLQGDPLALCPEGTVWVDVGAFEDAAVAAHRTQDPAAYRAAVDLYTGDLLPEDRYEDWAIDRREDLRRVYLSLLTGLARLYETQDQFEPAIDILRQAVDAEPTDQGAQVDLMRLYVRSGQHYQALQQYRLFQDLLSRELDIEIDPQVRQSYLAVLKDSLPITGPSTADLALPHVRGPAAAFIHRHNLPAPVTTFVGREREIGEVTRLLDQARLLTLVGPGGCGKTRLALEVAARLVEDYPDGVWLVELAALADPDLVPDVVASTLDLHKQPERPLTATLTDALETRHPLLILDNCEHLAAACAALAHALLLGCPHLRILATSRQALGIAGEQVWRVPSLELPQANVSLPAEQVARAEAVRLFLDRAQMTRPGFALVDSNAGTVTEICRRLDGIPLAIELAASRLRLLSVDQIATLLDDRFRLLTGGSRTALPRQQTLRATIDWSYDLLGKEEQILFNRLAVFAGGWTLEAAEAVCAGPGVAAHQILDRMAALVDRSQVSAEEGDDGTMRYRFLETLRQYAQEQLAVRGEADQVQQRHAAYYLALAERAEPELGGPQQVAWLNRLDKEHDNLRAALRWSLEHGQAETAARLSGALGMFWYVRAHLNEGIRWLDASLDARSTLTLPLRAKALTYAGMLKFEQGDYAQGQAEVEQSLCLWRTLGDRYWTALDLNILGCNLREQGQLGRATTLLEQGLQVARETGDSDLIGLSLLNLGHVARYQGDDTRSAAMCRESLALFRKAGDLRRAAFSLINLAHIANQQGDPEQALALYREGLELAQRVGDRRRLIVCLEGVANVALAWGEPAAAARLLGAAEALRNALGAPPSVAQRTVYGRFAGAVGAADEAAYRTVWVEGQAMTLEQAIDYAHMVRLSRLPATRGPGELPAEGGSALLTAREATVAALLACEMTNREIAQKLVITEGTVANHVHHILAKLGLASREEIAAWAIAHGLHRES